MKTLTVLVPCYNMEKYVDQCISSLLDDRINDAIEILAVDDGSSDNTVEIIKKWVKKYPKTVNLVEKENGGHGSTINVGISLASGEYFRVLDSDDWVEHEAFIKYVNSLKEIHADYIVTNFNKCYHQTNFVEKVDAIGETPCSCYLDFESFINNGMVAMHSGTIRTKILRDNNIKLSEHCFYVDAQYNLFPILFIDSFYCLPLTVYQYRLEREGQSMSSSGFLKHIEDHRRVMISLCDFYQNLQCEEKKKAYLLGQITNQIGFEFAMLAHYALDDSIQIESMRKFNTNLQIKYPLIYSKIPGKSFKMMKFLRFHNLWLVKLALRLKGTKKH